MHHTEPTHRHHSEERFGGTRDVASAVSNLVTSMTGAVDSFVRTVGPSAPVIGRRRHRRPIRHDQCCDPQPCEGCGHSSCHCDCCVGDVDLVVYARVGETRVVPIRVENARARERTIKLELSDFSSKGGKDAPVTGSFFGESSFTLKPCESRDVVIVVRVAGDKLDEQDRTGADRTRGLPDVDDCLVAVADLRVEGCDTRPVRVAVAILPRDCGLYEIECGCGCC